MKSKLFLSLSLLTAVFSMNAVPAFNNPETETIPGIGTPVYRKCAEYNLRAGQFLGNGLEKTIAKIGTTATSALCLGTITVVTGGTVYALNKFKTDNSPKNVVLTTRFERAKFAIQNGYASVKANTVKGYNSSLTFVKANPKSTAGAVATVVALGYVAYKNSDLFFGKAKPVQTQKLVQEPAPVKRTMKHIRD